MKRRPLLTGTLAALTALVWSLAALVTFGGQDDEAFQPGAARNLPPISSGPGTVVIDEPGLPFTFAVPEGFAIDPAAEHLELVPESWLPTPAVIRMSWTTSTADFDDLDWPILEPTGEPVVDHLTRNGYRAVISSPGAPGSGRFTYRLYQGLHAVTITAEPPASIDTYDTSVLPRAVDALTWSLRFR